MTHVEKRFKNKIIAFVFLLIILGISASMVRYHQQQWQKERALALKQVLQTQIHSVESTVSKNISSAKILGAWVQSQAGKTGNFDRFADSLINALGGITNLQLAPDGIVQYIYPLSGNEKAIGHNILSDDSRRTEARLALMSNQLTLAGPFNLLQGGIAIIGRQPVFLERDLIKSSPLASTTNIPSSEDSNVKQRYFWGFASALINFNQLIGQTSLAEFYEQGYYFQLWRRHPDTGVKEIISQNTLREISDDLHGTIELPNAIWHLSIEEIKGFHQQLELSTIIFLFLAFDLLLSYTLYRHLCRMSLTRTNNASSESN